MPDERGDDMIWYTSPYQGSGRRIPDGSLIHVCPAITIVSQFVRRDVLDPVAVGTCRCCGRAMPRIKQRRYHVYDGTTLTYSGLRYKPPLTQAEEAAIPNETPEERRANEHLYQIETWIDGPRAGEETIVFLGGENWIPAHWPVRSSTRHGNTT